MCDSVKTDKIVGHKLRPIGGLWSFFSRMRILAGGHILEDIDMLNRVHEMLSIFTPEASRENDYAEGVVMFWEHVVDLSHCNVDHLKAIPYSSSQTVLFRPLSGTPNQR